MRYLQLLLFFAVVIVSYRWLGSPLPVVATASPTPEIEAPTTTPPAETEAVPTEIPNE
jgi:hypothetical protein